MGWFWWLKKSALKKARQEEKKRLPTKKELADEDMEFKKEAKELGKIVSEKKKAQNNATRKNKPAK
jgi:hypothetical protein